LYAKAGEPKAPWKLVRAYPVLAASGHLGPKLREGDLQVPEGVYGIDYLNPNSLYDVSMRVSYPNAFDQARAAEEGRNNLGGAIMIHGRAASVGCLAMGDVSAEELFTLAAAVGKERIRVILTPVDFRSEPRPAVDGAPAWVGTLYGQIEAALKELPEG
jgi:murein L,D-transpeptidase YafK